MGFNFDNIYGGPCYVRNKIEAKVFEDYVTERNNLKKKNINCRGSANETYNNSYIRAKSILQKEVLDYIDHCFNLSETRENSAKQKNKTYPTYLEMENLNPQVEKSIYTTKTTQQKKTNEKKENDIDKFIRAIPKILSQAANQKASSYTENEIQHLEIQNQTFVNRDGMGQGPLSEGSTYLEGKTGAHFESVYTRKSEKNLADRIAAFRKKQKKKREKIKKILAKREAKKATGFINEDTDEGYYKGIGVTDEEAKSKMSVRNLAGKLTKAENIGGVRRVLKPTSKGFEVIDLTKSPRKTDNTIASAIQINTAYKESSGYGNTIIRDEVGENPEMDVPIPHKEKELQAERNLIAELLMMGAKAVEKSSTIDNCNQSKEKNSIFEEFEMAQTPFSSIPQFQDGIDDTLLDI